MGATEFQDFCKRREKYIADCSDRLSELIGDVNLLTPWKKSKSASRAIACNYGDYEQSDASAVNESFDAVEKYRASNGQGNP
ncbi:hypothetical protein GOP47_0021393 [Adiantum capillus-veneris]|uniref:Uncharacterized protein n=1 Tax=Adiantum capillus-veneris TaxID=13818 RepID=A0A9D4Z7T8_ADICA|nr:hypothetical protein GOP47_0021393 [Adiantum capillus-veneris]